MNVCASCRSTSPSTAPAPDGEVDAHGLVVLICAACGSRILRVSAALWAPPKKTNSRAWKRIAAGELLWDRRRAARSMRRRKHSSPDEAPGRGLNGRLLTRAKPPRPGSEFAQRPDVGPSRADWRN